MDNYTINNIIYNSFVKTCIYFCFPPGGAADRAGLKSGDVITKLNREKVNTASADGLARIIKYVL